MSRLDAAVVRANRANRDDAFKRELLDVLNRIAIALEQTANPLITLPPDPPNPEFQEIQHWITHDGVCVCGNDMTRTCDSCSPARIAEVYKSGGLQ